MPLANLHFIDGIGERIYNQRHTDHLEELFRRTSINHSNQRHWVDGYIDGSNEVSILRDVGLTWSQLREKNSHGEYPYVTHVVAYTQGRHRVEAAKRIDPSSCWTVRLYSTDRRSFRANRIVKSRTEQYQHELTNSDGHIYSKLREYYADSFNYCEWHGRLSKTKQKAFFYITMRPPIANALDRLMPLKGVIEFLQLSSFLKIFDQRLDDELLAGLKHVHMQWSAFIGGNNLRALDKKSVAALEGQAPTVSDSDHMWINTAFSEGQLFPGVTNVAIRSDIERRVLASRGIICGLRSLHSNMQYLCIGAEAIWSYLIPKELRTTAKAKAMSLSATLQSCWSGTESYVEIEEGVFQPACGPPSFNLSYIQLILSALRLFPYLTDAKPKVERGQKVFLSIDVHCISALHQRAKLLGFHTLDFDLASVDSMLHVNRRQWRLPQVTKSANEADLLSRSDHRWGRPYKEVYRILQTQAFLPTIARLSTNAGMSIAFVLRELITVYFPPCTFELDNTRSPVRIEEECIIQSAGKSRVYPHSTVALQTITEIDETDGCNDGLTNSTTANFLPIVSDSDVSMNDIQETTRGIYEEQLQLPARDMLVQHSTTVAESHQPGGAKYSTGDITKLECTMGGRASIDNDHTSEVTESSDISMHEVEMTPSQAPLHSVDRSGISVSASPSEVPWPKYVSSTCASTMDVQGRKGAQLSHFDQRQEDQILHQGLFCGQPSVSSAVEAWRRQIQPALCRQRPLTHQVNPAGNDDRQTPASSLHSRSTNIGSPRRGHARTIASPSLEQRRNRRWRKRRRRRPRDNGGEARRTREYTALPNTFPLLSSSAPSCSTIIDQAEYRLSQDFHSGEEHFVPGGHFNGMSNGSSSLSSLSQGRAQAQGPEPRPELAQVNWSDYESRAQLKQPNERHLSASTKSRSTCARSLSSVKYPLEGETAMDGYISQPLDVDIIRDGQQRGGQRSSMWQGFDDSDDDFVSIDI